MHELAASFARGFSWTGINHIIIITSITSIIIFIIIVIMIIQKGRGGGNIKMGEQEVWRAVAWVFLIE